MVLHHVIIERFHLLENLLAITTCEHDSVMNVIFKSVPPLKTLPASVAPELVLPGVMLLVQVEVPLGCEHPFTRTARECLALVSVRYGSTNLQQFTAKLVWKNSLQTCFTKQ